MITEGSETNDMSLEVTQAESTVLMFVKEYTRSMKMRSTTDKAEDRPGSKASIKKESASVQERKNRSK